MDTGKVPAKDFHRRILLNGGVPLNILGHIVTHGVPENIHQLQLPEVPDADASDVDDSSRSHTPFSSPLSLADDDIQE